MPEIKQFPGLYDSTLLPLGDKLASYGANSKSYNLAYKICTNL
jgi:hypothetical protein